MADTKITGLTAHTALIDTDVLPVVDITAVATKKTTWANIKSVLKTYFDTLYAAALGADDNYVTDAEKIVIGNTSGTNTGDASGHSALAPLASPTFTGTVTLPVGLTGVIRTDSGVVSVDSDVTDIVAAGTESAAGKLELATDAETITGTDTARAVTPANIQAKVASLTAKGIVELATTAEIDTGTDSTRAVPVDQFVASARNVRYILYRVVEAATDWSADATAAIGGAIAIPFTGTIVDIEADVDTAGTTGTAIVDVNLNGSTIMTTNKLKWDSTEKSTRTYSGTAPGLTTTAVTAGDLISVDIDTNHTTKSKGLTLFLAIRLT